MKAVYRLSTVLDFGRHKDEDIQHVIDTNPTWLAWAEENVEGFTLSEDAELALDIALDWMEVD